MPIDNIKAVRPLKASKPNAGGANTVDVPVLAIVKDNIDPNRSGRIFVYISDNSGNDPDNRDNWIQVSFLSPFFGRTNSDGGTNDFGSYKANPSSYGLWNSPPDVGTTVLCIFVNGDMNYGFYIGCVPDPDALQMVPAIGATENIIANKGEAESYGGAIRLPVTNINSNNRGVSDSPDYLTAPKPVHTYSAAIMFRQGILRDPVRGPISSSAQREPASRVGWGISTPGRPIYEGGFDDQTIADNLQNTKNASLRVVARRGGHSIVMDDGDVIGRDQLIRIRTALGHQIMMSDDGQTLMILHSNGQSYVELGKEGTIDVYATNSVNIRTQGDLNLHADNNININAAKSFNIKAESIQIDTEKDFKQRIGADHKSSVTGSMTMKAGKTMSMESEGEASFASKAIAYINGSKIHLNTGKTGTIPEEVKELTLTAHTDTLFDKTKGYLASPGKLKSIVSRAPAHAPWADAGLGVDVKVDLNSSSQLPSAPKPEVAATNVASGAAVENPVTPAQIAKQEAPRAVSQAIDKPTTNSILGQLENQTRSGPAAAAVTKGVAVVTTPTSKEVSVGVYGMSPKQMESAGFIKPGSATMVEAQINSGKTPEQAMPDNIWTGKNGIQSLQMFRDNKTAQADAAVSLMQQSQTALINANLMTGKEAAPQIAGLVMSGAKSGIEKTIEAVKGLGTIAVQAGSQALTKKLVGEVSGAVRDIAGGNFAAGLAQSVSNNLGSIGQALVAGQKIDVSESLRGVAGSAFNEIVRKMPRLKAGIPQNLAVIIKQSLEKEFKNSSKVSDLITNVASDVQSALPNIIGREVSREVSKVLPTTGTQIGQTIVGSIGAGAADITKNILENSGNIVAQISNPSTYTNAVSSVGQTLAQSAVQISRNAGASASASFAAGLSNIPGGPKAVSAIVNRGTEILNSGVGALIPGTGKISALVKDASAAALNGVNAQLSRIKDPLDRLASSGLSAGAAAQLQASIASIASAGAASVKLPTFAVNTLNTEEINESFNSILDDPGIPRPAGLSEISDVVKTKFEELEKEQAERVAAAVRLRDLGKQRSAATLAYKSAINQLPAGDPEIEKKKQELLTLLADPEYKRLSDKISGA